MEVAISCTKCISGGCPYGRSSYKSTLTRYSAGSSRSYVVQKIIIWESCGREGEADVRVDTAALQQQNGSKEN